GGRTVVAGDVVPHHPGGLHPRTEVGQGVPDGVHPALGHADGVAPVEQRRDPLLDQVVQGGRFQVVTPPFVADPVRGGDRPAVVSVVQLVPPAVGDGQVQRTV